MKWKKLDFNFTPDHTYPWMVSHAANCVAEHLSDHVFRIYFSCRNVHRQAHIGYIDLDLRSLYVTAVSPSPVVKPGNGDAFDKDGVSLSSIVFHKEKRYLYYIGWHLTREHPWQNTIGLAIAEGNDAAFRKWGKNPVVGLSEKDPYSLSYPFVLKDGTTFKMWYGSNTDWGEDGKTMNHTLKYAESEDGIHWHVSEKTCFELTGRDHAFSRPFVLKEEGKYKMWYSYRGQQYRIGYAESEDGIYWERKDELAGIDVSKSGWDSESVEYPFIFDHDGNRYLLYNGNGYGKTGFGLAMLEI